MLTPIQKLHYLTACASKRLFGQGLCCPSCACAAYTTLDRKFLVTSLRRCKSCKLLYRAPVITESEYDSFYQAGYSEGFTTDLPSEGDLHKLTSNSFVGSGKDFRKYIRILDMLSGGLGSDLLDFGCSWGYGSWQLSKAGYRVKAFEVCRARCSYARQSLGVDACSDIQAVANSKFDIFFSSHVLEHIPDIKRVVDLAHSVVRPGGYFVSFTPNGSSEYRRLNPKSWHNAWGFVHPLVIDPEFLQNAFYGKVSIVDTSEFDAESISQWVSSGCEESLVLNLDGNELLFIAKM